MTSIRRVIPHLLLLLASFAAPPAEAAPAPVEETVYPARALAAGDAVLPSWHGAPAAPEIFSFPSIPSASTRYVATYRPVYLLARFPEAEVSGMEKKYRLHRALLI